MGKKRNKGRQQQASIPHKEAFQRMNFLFQASLLSLSTHPTQPQLSRFYIHTMKTIAKRLVLHLDPSVKRLICKSCDSLLIPGISCTHRLRSRRSKHLVVKCLTCGGLKRYHTETDHQLWSEKPENILAVLPESEPEKKSAEESSVNNPQGDHPLTYTYTRTEQSASS